MPPELSIVALLLTAAAVAGASSRFGFSSPLVLTVVGIALSFVPGVPQFTLTPQIALVGFLPPLLYASAIRTPFVDMRRNKRPILLLSIGLVLVTAFAVAGVAVVLLPDLPFAAAVALGAVVAPPDAVAASAVARRVGMPRRIVTILEGESLFNDATALVALRTALGALAGTLSVVGAAGDFARAVVVGVAAGALVAAVMTPVRRRVGSDPVLDTSLSLLVPYVAYLGAEELHGSGVLAVVVAGLVLGHRSPDIQSAASRVTERTLWRSVTFVLENVVFLLIGLQLRGLVEQARAGAVSGQRIVLLCVAVTVTVIVVRIAWMFPAVHLQRLLPSVRREEPKPRWQQVLVLSWAGMRGVVTLAAGFALVTAHVRHGEVLLLAAFAVVAGTLLVQGATLPWLVRTLHVEGPDRAQDALQQALVLQRAVEAGQQRLGDQTDGDTPRDVVDSLRGWSDRVAHSVWERLGTSGRSEPPARAFRRLRTEMLRAERQVVVDVYRSGKVPAEVLEDVMERLDQEEAMLIAFGEGSAVGRSELLTPTGVQECDHLRSEPLLAEPSTPDGCEDCLRIGEHAWVSLRMCLRCGHVGCCDSSPRRHAAGHYGDVGHPVMRSIELGEGWRWCFVDRIAG